MLPLLFILFLIFVNLVKFVFLVYLIIFLIQSGHPWLALGLAVSIINIKVS